MGGGVGVEGIAMGRGGVEGDGGEVGLAESHNLTAATDIVVIDLGGDEEFGEVAYDERDLLYLVFGGEDFEQSVGYRAGGEEGGAVTEEVGVGRREHEYRRDVEVVCEAVGVDGPEAGGGLREGCADGGFHLGEVDKAADETSLGDKLLEVGRYGGAGGEYHGVGDGRRSE
ncbi:hypothetical protein IKZ77_00970 [Candidatus Saccharibacteria bacterium]|nr:hypothetical protein [Candidatus Saccharibacteria bacterium]